MTIDTAISGLRERDLRNGTKELLTRNTWTMLPYVYQILTRPRWLAGFIGDGGLMEFPNIVLPDGPMSYADIGDDARRAVDEGAHAIVVSSHGGRQLDSVYPTLCALPECAVRSRSFVRI